MNADCSSQGVGESQPLAAPDPPRPTLGEFVAGLTYPILKVSVEGRDDAELIPLGGGVRFAGESSWRALRGEVDPVGVWRWDGRPSRAGEYPDSPSPRDPHSLAWQRWVPGRVLSIMAYHGPRGWRESLVNWRTR